jgi:hypothetical protein
MGSGWTALRLQRLGQWNEENCRRFPKTVQVITCLPLFVLGPNGGGMRDGDPRLSVSGTPLRVAGPRVGALSICPTSGDDSSSSWGGKSQRRLMSRVIGDKRPWPSLPTSSPVWQWHSWDDDAHCGGQCQVLAGLDIPFAVRGVMFARQLGSTGVAPHSDGRNFILTAHLGLQVRSQPAAVYGSAGGRGADELNGFGPIRRRCHQGAGSRSREKRKSGRRVE